MSQVSIANQAGARSGAPVAPPHLTTATTTNTSGPADVPTFVDRIVRPLTKILNPLILRVAGGWWFPIFSRLQHRGHRSGRTYVTPISALPRGGFFWLGLTFGENAGWARNVIAAGEADLRYRGTDYHLVEATVLDGAEVSSELPRLMRFGLSGLGVHKVIRMRPIASGRERGAKRRLRA